MRTVLNFVLALGVALGVAVAMPTSQATAGETAASVATEYVTLGETRYAYRSLGSKGGVPLICISRFRANMDDWDPAFLDALAATRHVIIFNQSGVSSSNGTMPTTIGGMAADTVVFAQAMGFDEVDILGWSMGGFVVQAMLMDAPDLVRRAVLIGTGPAASSATPGPKPAVFEVAMKGNREDGTTTYSDEDRALLFFADDAGSLERAEASFARIDAARRSDEPVTGAAEIQTQTTAIQRWWFDPGNGYFNRMGEIMQPVLIVDGDRDAFFTVAAQTVMFSQIQNASLALLPNAGHGPHHQEPAYVAQLIERFLD